MHKLSQLQKGDVFVFLGSTDRMEVLHVMPKLIIFMNLTADISHCWYRNIDFLEYTLIIRDGRLL